jgi:hypothetical protein
MSIWFGRALWGLAVAALLASCSGSGPDKAFQAREVVVADPGWTKGQAVKTGVTLGEFAEALPGDRKWEKGEGGASVLRVTGPVPGSGEKAETLYTFVAADPKLATNAALLTEVRRGTKVFSKAEIWSVATEAAKAAKAKAGK